MRLLSEMRAKAVIDGVVTPAPMTPREQLSLYQADLRLQQRGLEYQKEQIGFPGHPSSAAAQQMRDIDQQLKDLAERRELLETVARTDLATGMTPEILHFDPKVDGQIVVAHGDIGNASHIAVMVSGMTTDLENFKATNGRALAADCHASRSADQHTPDRQDRRAGSSGTFEGYGLG